MSNQGRYRDRNPGLRAAGLVTTIPEESTEICVKPRDEKPPTPPNIKKFRKSFNADPGAKQIHYGVAEDPLPPQNHTYGKKTHASDHVHEVIGPNNLNGLAEYENKIKEDKYHSNKREPLGQTLSRDYQYPPDVHNPQFRFGYPVIPSESAKNLLFPQGGSLEENEQVAKMYEKSHGATGAGQQMNRDYRWPVDPASHRFGLPDPKELNGAAQALHPERYQTNFPKTTIVQKTVEDFKSAQTDHLGRPKNLGQGRPNIDPNMAFGISTQSKDAWDAGRCIHGQPNDRELQPDVDLGRSTRYGFRNQPLPGDDDRVFGVPSIRNDIPKKKQKSVADPQNYGDEVPAVQILYPDYWQRFGLEPDAFYQPRPKAELRDLFDSIGLGLKVGKFEAIHSKAAEEGPVSIYSFIWAMRWFEQQGLK